VFCVWLTLPFTKYQFFSTLYFETFAENGKQTYLELSLCTRTGTKLSQALDHYAVHDAVVNIDRLNC